MIAILLFVAQTLDPSQFDPQNWFKPACPTCGIHGYVDYPAPSADLSGTIAGWGLECGSGQPVDRVELFYESDDARWIPLKQDPAGLHAGQVYRPDVFAAYARYCQNVGTQTGWWLELSNPPPAGARRLLIQLWRGPYHAELIRTWAVQ